MGSSTREYTERDVLEVRKPYADPVANGAANGAFVGAGLGFLKAVSWIAYNREGYAVFAVYPAIRAGVGAALGLAIDGVIQKDHLIYRAEPRTSSGGISIEPFFSPMRQGVTLAVRF